MRAAEKEERKIRLGRDRPPTRARYLTDKSKKNSPLGEFFSYLNITSTKIGLCEEFNLERVCSVRLEYEDLVLARFENGSRNVECLLGACLVEISSEVEAVDLNKSLLKSVKTDKGVAPAVAIASSEEVIVIVNLFESWLTATAYF